MGINYKRFNNSLAVRITLLMSTMECVYLFTAWSLLPLAAPGLQSLVFYVSGGILQLVALPLIMVGQHILNAASEQRAEEDHQRLMTSLELLHDLVTQMHAVVTAETLIESEIAGRVNP